MTKRNRLSDTIFDGYVLNKDGVMVESGWFLKEMVLFPVSLEKSSSKNGKKSEVWYYFDKDGVMLSQTIVDGFISLLKVRL